MLVVFIVAGVLLLVGGIVAGIIGDSYNNDILCVSGIISGVIGFFMFVGSSVAFFCYLDTYNDIRSTINGKIEVCEQCKVELLQELDSTIADYCGYESEFYKEFKHNPEKAAFTLYPELKGNDLYLSKMRSIQSYNDDIMKLKMEKVNLKSYKLWIGDMDWLYGSEE